MSSRLPIPLLGPRGRKRARTRRAFNRIGTGPPGRWSNANTDKTPALRSKPVTDASRLVTHYAPSVASGRRVKIPATGPAHLRLYSHSERLRARTSRSLARTFPRRIVVRVEQRACL